MNRTVTNTEFVRKFNELTQLMLEGTVKTITIKQRNGDALVARLKRKA